MATEVKRRRGTTVEHSTFTGAVAELTVDLTKDTVVVHDGATQGGFPLLREDFSNVPTTAPFTNISLDTAIFDTTYTETGSETQGTLYWNSDEETLSLVTNGESIELGQKVEIHVKNQTGAQINKGEVVYASGTVGASGRILVTKMIADGTIAAKRVLGVAAENIANGADGKVIKFGKLRQINTSTFSDGDILWVSTTTAGGFQNTEPSQANGEIALPIAYVVYSSASVGEIFIRVTPIDENEYQDYDAGLEDISGLTPSDSTIIVGDGTNWVAESGDTARASLGLSIGSDVQAWDAQLDTLSGLSADQATAIVAVTTSEYQQLQNIDSVTISNTQWGYLGELDQSLTQASSPTFAGLTVDGLVIEDEVRTLQSDVIENHLEIESLQDNKVEVGFLFPDGDGQALGTGDAVTFSTVNTGQGNNELYAMNQNVQTTDAVTFATVNTGQGANELYAMNQDVQTTDAVTFATVNTGQGDNELYAMNQDVQTTDDVTFNVIDVTDKIESASGFTSGIIGAGTIYDMNDGNGSFFEVDNMRVRNELRAHVFKKDIVKASNAYLFITDSAEIAETSVIVDTTDTFRVLADGSNASFAHGDLLWAKNIDDDGSLQVTGVKIEVSVQPQFVWDTSTETWNTSTITPDSYTEFASGTVTGGIHDGKTFTEYNIYEVTSGGTLNAGDTIVRVSGGSILNDASSTYSPFIDIYDGVQTWAQFQDVSKTKVRLGNLEGVSNASGYGLYTQNAFLTGALVVGDLTKAGNYIEYSGGNLSGVFNDIDFDSNTFSLETTNLRIDSQDEIIQIGSGDWVELGRIASTEYGLSLNDNNYWKYNTLTGAYFFKVGSATNFMSFNTASGTLDIETDEFLLTAGEMSIDSNNGVVIDGSNFFKQDKTFSFGGGLLSGTSSTLSISGSGASIDVDTFTLDAGTAYLTSSNDGVIVLDTIDANLADIDSGTGFYADGAGNLRIGDSNTYLKFDTTNGLQIKIGDDDLSTAIADIRSDLIDIYLADQSTFAGIQFLSGQITLKVGSDGKVASARLDATGAESAITLRADYFDFQSNDIVLIGDPNQDGGTQAKIALGASANSITIDGTEVGFIADGAGEFKAYADANNYIRLANSALDIKAGSFDLATTNLIIDSANELITLGSGTTVTLGKIDANNFGLSLDTHNFWKVSYGEYFFKIGTADNFISFDTSSEELSIDTDTFNLSAGELVIDSSIDKKIVISNNTEPIIAIGDFTFATEVEDTSSSTATSSTTTNIKTDATATNSATNMDSGFGTYTNSSPTTVNTAFVTLQRQYNNTHGKWIRVQFNYNAPKAGNEGVGDLAIGFTINYFGKKVEQLNRNPNDTNDVTGSVDEYLFVPNGAAYSSIIVTANAPTGGLDNVAPDVHGRINLTNLAVTEISNTYTYTDIGNNGFRVYNSGGRNKLDFTDGKAEGTFETLSIGSWDFVLDSDGNLELQYDGTLVQQFTRPT